MTRSLATLLAASFLTVAACAQTSPSAGDPHQWKMTASDTPTQISEHVWMVKGNPNIAFIVGARSVMVVDTGMRPAMGRIVAGFAAKLAPGKRLYLTTTHFHPEHAAGDAGFPADTILIRNDAQQMEVEHDGMDMVKAFMEHSAENREKDEKRGASLVSGHGFSRAERSLRMRLQPLREFPPCLKSEKWGTRFLAPREIRP